MALRVMIEGTDTGQIARIAVDTDGGPPVAPGVVEYVLERALEQMRGARLVGQVLQALAQQQRVVLAGPTDLPPGNGEGPR